MTALQDDPDPIDSYVEDALKAFAAANDLDALKAARLGHVGDRSPLALAARDVATLPPEARAENGKAVARARSTVEAAANFRQALLGDNHKLMLIPPMPDPVPLPDGPFVWVLTLDRTATHEMADRMVRTLTATLPEDVRERSRIILLAPGWSLQALGDDELRELGLQRIEAP